MLFCYARWPWVFAGTVTAIRDWVVGSSAEFRVTPKGSDPAGPLPARVLMPYVFLSVTSALAVLLLRHVGTANGFYVFAIANAAIYATLLLVIVIKHIRENGIVVKGAFNPGLRACDGGPITASSRQCRSGNPWSIRSRSDSLGCGPNFTDTGDIRDRWRRTGWNRRSRCQVAAEMAQRSRDDGWRLSRGTRFPADTF